LSIGRIKAVVVMVGSGVVVGVNVAAEVIFISICDLLVSATIVFAPDMISSAESGAALALLSQALNINIVITANESQLFIFMETIPYDIPEP
jgi:hypothetical protein